MKKNLLSIVCCVVLLGMTTAFVSCKKDDANHCTDGKYWCSSAQKCCPSDKRYHDGHGTCWSSMSSCRTSGYGCETCHPE